MKETYQPKTPFETGKQEFTEKLEPNVTSIETSDKNNPNLQPVPSVEGLGNVLDINSLALETFRHQYEENSLNLIQGELWHYLLKQPAESVLYQYFAEFWEEKLALNDIAQIKNIYLTIYEKIITKVYAGFTPGSIEHHIKKHVETLDAELLVPQFKVLQELAHKLKQIRVIGANKTLAEILILSRELPSQYKIYYAHFTKQAKANDYELLIEFLKQAQVVEKHCADLALLYKASNLPGHKRLALLLDNPLWAEYLSSKGLIIFLQFRVGQSYSCEEPTKKLLEETDGKLLAKLEEDDWRILLTTHSHLILSSFEREIQKTTSNLARYLKLQTILPLAYEDSFLAYGICRYTPWCKNLNDEILIKLTSILYRHELYALLTITEGRNYFTNRFLSIINNTNLREQFFSSISRRDNFEQITLLLLYVPILNQLNNEAFLSCIIACEDIDMKKLFNNIGFADRFIKLSGIEIAQLAKERVKKHRFSSLAEYILSSIELLNLLNDEQLVEVLMTVSTFDCFKEILKLRWVNNRIQGSILVKFLELGEKYRYKWIINDSDLMARISDQQVYSLFTKTENYTIFNNYKSIELDKFFKGRTGFLESLSNQQLLLMNRCCGNRCSLINGQIEKIRCFLEDKSETNPELNDKQQSQLKSLLASKLTKILLILLALALSIGFIVGVLYYAPSYVILLTGGMLIPTVFLLGYSLSRREDYAIDTSQNNGHLIKLHENSKSSSANTASFNNNHLTNIVRCYPSPLRNAKAKEVEVGISNNHQATTL